MNSWAEIEAKKYGEKAIAMIQAANLNREDFVQEACPPTFRIRHLQTQDYFAFGGENGGAMWSRPGRSSHKTSQTSHSQRLESWETKIKHFEGWLKELLEFLAAAAEHTAGEPRTPSAIVVPEPQTDLAEGSRSAMPLFVTSSQVTVVRNAGGAEKTRWVARVGGNMVSQMLFSAEDRPKTGDEIYSELFDEPRVITRVDPVLMNTGVSHWVASIVPKSEWIRRHPGQRIPAELPPRVAIAPDKVPTDRPVDDETLPLGEPDPLEADRGAQVPAERPERGDQKGDLKLLQKNDGSLYESVAFLTAEAYADISDRRRQQLMGDGTLSVVGKGQNRRITVASLIAYCPPTEKAK